MAASGSNLIPDRVPFGAPVNSDAVRLLLQQLGTLRRPELPLDDEFVYHDWILISRKGVELGFTDSQYQLGAPRVLWRHGELLLTQVYFYAGQDGVQPYTGELPFGLAWSDCRDVVRTKLQMFEATRHSHVTDTWDVANYRLTVAYQDHERRIDRIACRSMPAPMKHPSQQTASSLKAIIDAFGESLTTKSFLAMWPISLDEEDVLEVNEDSQLDLTQNFGATLGFAPSASGPVFRSITLHRERDMLSVGWQGELPQGLSFEDSPSTLFRKIADGTSLQPVQQHDAALSGHAVWHFEDYTLHVLYSNVDNRLLRVKLMAPGTWKCVEEDAGDDED